MKRISMLAVPAIGLAIASPASAQFGAGGIVFDPQSYGQLVEQLRNAEKQLQTVTNTYNQAVTAYNDVHGVTNISSVATLLNNSAAKSVLPADAQNLEQLMSSGSGGLGSLGSAVTNIRNGRKVTLPALPSSATDYDRATRTSLENRGEAAAKNAAIADAAYGSTTTHTTGLDQLQAQLEKAETEKDRQAITARIAIEQARIQNNAIQLQAVQMRQQAEEQLTAQQLREQRAANITADAASSAASVPQ
jgi:type IV secretion system protein VirB5